MLMMSMRLRRRNDARRFERCVWTVAVGDTPHSRGDSVLEARSVEVEAGHFNTSDVEA